MATHPTLKITDWPAPMQRAWEQAVAKGDLLEESGFAAHWSPQTQRKVRQTIGRFLAWCQGEGTVLEDSLLQDLLTKDTARAFHAQLEREVAPVTAAQYIVDLAEAGRVMDPGHDWGWLQRVGFRLQAQAKPTRNKLAKIVPPEDLVQCGLTIMEEASPVTGVRKAGRYRTGLMIALLACRPKRRGEFTSISLTEVTQSDGRYELYIPEENTKTRKESAFLVPDVLTEAFGFYLNEVRPLLLGDRSSDALWITWLGDDLTSDGFAVQVCKETRKHFGHSISPHLFRDCYVTDIVLQHPDLIAGASTALGHRDGRTTQTYYDQAGSASAHKALDHAIEEMRKNAAKGR